MKRHLLTVLRCSSILCWKASAELKMCSRQVHFLELCRVSIFLPIKVQYKLNLCVDANININIHLMMYKYEHKYKQHKYMNLRVCVYICTDIYRCTYGYKRMRIHIHTHTYVCRIWLHCDELSFARPFNGSCEALLVRMARSQSQLSQNVQGLGLSL